MDTTIFGRIAMRVQENWKNDGSLFTQWQESFWEKHILAILIVVFIVCSVLAGALITYLLKNYDKLFKSGKDKHRGE